MPDTPEITVDATVILHATGECPPLLYKSRLNKLPRVLHGQSECVRTLSFPEQV